MTPQAEVVEVVGAEDMDDEVLFKHINARHSDDIGLEDIQYSPLYSDSLIETHRAYHRRVHQLAMDGHYDHYHSGEN